MKADSQISSYPMQLAIQAAGITPDAFIYQSRDNLRCGCHYTTLRYHY